MLSSKEQVAFLKSVDNVQQASENYLGTHRSQQSVISFVANLQRSLSLVIQTAIDQGVGVACKAGCNYCCRARVEATAPEVFRIVREIEARPTEELNQFVQRLKAHVAMPDKATAWNQRIACPFLTNGLCSIYDVRPGVCRKAHSLDVRKCESYAAEIPQDLGIVTSVEALAKGTSEAYRKLGFDASSHELGRAVLLAISDPSAESRWYNGESVFVSKGTES